MPYATTDPYTGKVLKTFPNATDREIDRAIDAAHAAFLSWKESSFAERAKVMQSAADILRREVEPYAKLLTIEMGKLFSEAKAEVELSANIFEYYAQKAEALLAPEKLPVASPVEGEAVLVLEPLGVLL